jgi:SAM-dependent methyltransferase
VNDEEFRLLERIEEDHWWFAGKRRILRALLEEDRPRGRFLDLGCGTGGVLADWLHDCTCVGIDRSELGLRISREKGLTRLARAEVTAPPFRSGSFETIVLLDVLEHVDDDVGLLRAAAEVCAAEGRLVISVPAFELLWSQHDETFEHVRRYTRRGLLEVVERAGLTVERSTYTNAFLFPVAAVWRLASRRLGLSRIAPKHDFWPIPRWLNSFLEAFYRLEARWLRRANLPVGLSVVCIARRRLPGAPPARTP